MKTSIKSFVIDMKRYTYVKKGQSEYLLRMKKAIEDEEYEKWMIS
jgi:hypothetical protein